MPFPLDPSAYNKPKRRKLPEVDFRARTQVYTGRLARRVAYMIRENAALVQAAVWTADRELTVTWAADVMP